MGFGWLEVRTVDPYRRLVKGHARPCHTILLHFTSTPLATLVGSLYRRHLFLASIAFTSLLSEVLVIMIAGVPFNSSQIWAAFLVSTYSSISILSLMICALLALFWWRRQPELPRMPNTVA